MSSSRDRLIRSLMFDEVLLPLEIAARNMVKTAGSITVIIRVTTPGLKDGCNVTVTLGGSEPGFGSGRSRAGPVCSNMTTGTELKVVRLAPGIGIETDRVLLVAGMTVRG